MGSPFDLYRGERIGKYEILTQLSIGGMAELFLAFTSGPGGFRKYVVLQRILPDVRGDEQFVRMFLDEARITAAFSHPNIAQVFDLGEDGDDLYLAMEFISGQNLNQVAGACRRQKLPMPVGFAVTVARDVLNALHYAHHFTDPTGQTIPVIHRDVAHKNVMVTYDGVVKLLDFGIAQAKGKLGRTGNGMVKGTTGYMSPEQVRGDELDGRSDVFAVGVMLHEMLTGRRLFSGLTEVEEMELILSGPVARAHTVNTLVPEELSDVVNRALAREKADRFASARDMARALERATGHLAFDQEQLAAFMRERFEEKMAATRALLESAGEADMSLLVLSALGELRSAKENPHEFVELYPKSSPSAESSPAVLSATAPPTVASPAPEEPGPRFGLAWAALILAVIVGGGYGAWRLEVWFPPSESGGIAEQMEVRPLPTFQDPRLARYQADAGPGFEQAKGRAPSKASSGYLTLVTTPEATVVRGQEVLGRTPLFKASLSEGTHLLRLQTSDGKVHLLSAPIERGQTTMFRLELKDLPVER